MKKYILGPCLLESYELAFHILRSLSFKVNTRDFYFKASFDKANRSSNGERGLGLEKSVEIFKQLKKDFPGISITTDVHEVHQLDKLEGVVDLVQIPAFLCRQTDLIVESARRFEEVNIKKGQWMAPTNMVKVLDKIKTKHPSTKVYLTERGTSFGHEKLIVDFSTVDYFKSYFDGVYFDVGHSTHINKPNGRIGGDRDLAKKYFQTGFGFGYDGIFAEIHPTPDTALSDSESTLELFWVLDQISPVYRSNRLHYPISSKV